ncbi:hypothetical protein Mgra_00000297 [Meloidogyne graminicola]|uniref:Uncharacterized protein n=1 Tax=Meloidogyne graminicola TaxID=189291 RepID=A0A8T0A584_9BILA|nr:hypothetical protein Mgra_00000297 [Meloidogyne graminicola]
MLQNILIILFCFLLIDNSVKSALPPKYLGLCNWKDCVGEKEEGTHKSLCLPETKPEACPQETWEQLIETNELPPC